MKACYETETLQMEITNHCHHSCSNCTRLCGHHYKPYYMDLGFFKQAVDCSCESPNFLGIMGGEPLLHPEFEKMCEYAAMKKPKDKLALWTGLPPGYEHYADVICDTFGHILINDHSRDDVYHGPVLVAAEEIIPDRPELFVAVNHCWLQEAWSSSINPKGAFFCEIAASLSILLEGSMGWPVEPGWWKRTPKDFTAQIEEYCPQCGIALSLPRRASVEGIDDVSPGMIKKLEGRSRRIDRGQYRISDLKLVREPEPMASYKDPVYRQRTAARYNILLIPNEQGYQSPVLAKSQIFVAEKTIYQTYQEKYQNG